MAIKAVVKKQPVEVVRVNQNGHYHHHGCEFYDDCEFSMSETAAIAAGYICGSCCRKD